MKINLKSGIDKLVFGMKEKDVTEIYGKPNRSFKDDEDNTIYLYDKEKLRLTFYQDEDFKLGYIIATNPALELYSNKIIGQKWDTYKDSLKDTALATFETENFDSEDHFFNEANWIIFRVEFNEVIRVELGAAINDKDEFVWKF